MHRQGASAVDNKPPPVDPSVWGRSRRRRFASAGVSRCSLPSFWRAGSWLIIGLGFEQLRPLQAPNQRPDSIGDRREACSLFFVSHKRYPGHKRYEENRKCHNLPSSSHYISCLNRFDMRVNQFGITLVPERLLPLGHGEDTLAFVLHDFGVSSEMGRVRQRALEALRHYS